jgi:DNA-binding transcriptional ArsR family regulator
MTHSPSLQQLQADLFTALGHPVRLEILNVLKDGEVCVCHIQAMLNQRQAYISQQMNVLRNAGLVTARKEGQRVFYQISNPEIYALLDGCGQMLHREGLWRGQAEVEEVKTPMECHCPRCSGQNHT